MALVLAHKMAKVAASSITSPSTSTTISTSSLPFEASDARTVTVVAPLPLPSHALKALDPAESLRHRDQAAEESVFPRPSSSGSASSLPGPSNRRGPNSTSSEWIAAASTSKGSTWDWDRSLDWYWDWQWHRKNKKQTAWEYRVEDWKEKIQRRVPGYRYFAGELGIARQNTRD